MTAKGVAPTSAQDNEGVWLFHKDPLVSAKQDWHMARPSHRPSLGNEASMEDTLWRQRASHGPRRGDHSLPVPADFPRPQLAMPDQAFHPDFFTLASWHFCSHRLRAALGQPPETIEYIPVELVAGSAGARAKDYALMRVLAWEDVIDLSRSEFTPVQGIDPVTGAPREEALWIDRLAFLRGVRPRHQVFKADRTQGEVFATDAVAERVMRARCTGAEFRDPTVTRYICPRRIRTATGVKVFE